MTQLKSGSLETLRINDINDPMYIPGANLRQMHDILSPVGNSSLLIPRLIKLTDSHLLPFYALTLHLILMTGSDVLSEFQCE